MSKIEKGQFGEPLSVIHGGELVNRDGDDLGPEEATRAVKCVNVLDGWDIEEVRQILEDQPTQADSIGYRDARSWEKDSGGEV